MGVQKDLIKENRELKEQVGNKESILKSISDWAGDHAAFLALVVAVVLMVLLLGPVVMDHVDIRAKLDIADLFVQILIVFIVAAVVTGVYVAASLLKPKKKGKKSKKKSKKGKGK